MKLGAIPTLRTRTINVKSIKQGGTVWISRGGGGDLLDKVYLVI